ncbi:Fe2+ transport system protein B [Evansella vedderi]|uniref:Fe2+ transport system protein B n=1 Tax=Evansella vedderi TaxID=38282 RepID=A0ABT9ZWC6_9BACI|nr:hypothetical protein [Evansella vedderi]MDQ0254783.1 Fe2+ transport system protein B [Evansella vedderi]
MTYLNHNQFSSSHSAFQPGFSSTDVQQVRQQNAQSAQPNWGQQSGLHSQAFQQLGGSNLGQQINFNQIQGILQQMEQMEQQHAQQLRQISNQLQQISQHEQMASQQAQQLARMFSQLIQENRRINQAYSYQSTTQTHQNPINYQ